MAWLFDGRDITDAGETDDEVHAYHQCICSVCGTLYDSRFPFCCELAAFAPLPRGPALAEQEDSP